jgi:tRNA1Val (adenine37-N6)-methyltransferase
VPPPGQHGHKTIFVANTYFQFKEFKVSQDISAMKVTTDSCLFGAWCADEIQKLNCTTILDIGTGTGLLALMIAQKNSGQINAVELDEKAARQALENISSSPWKERISIYHSDILEHRGKYDCIISNPPFYENELPSPDTRNNLAHHSLRLSLSDLVQYAGKSLADQGYIFLLLPYKRLAEIEKMLAEQNIHIHKKLAVKQTNQHSPFRIMIMGSKNRNKLMVDEFLSIKEGQDYSARFSNLLKDYYLYL